MTTMTRLSSIVRSETDPRVLHTGPSSLDAADRFGRALGWFSVGLGALQLLAPNRVTRALGIRGQEGLVQAYGLREIGSGMLSLSVDKEVGLWSRVAGDGLDVLTLLCALGPRNPKRANVGRALAVVAGITALDVLGAASVARRHTRGPAIDPGRYRNRSGFPQGLEKARGAARAAIKQVGSRGDRAQAVGS
jgi:hypothetical protein